MSRKEKKFEPTLQDVALAKALQSSIQKRKEQGKPLHTDTEIYIYKGPLPPERFGKD